MYVTSWGSTENYHELHSQKAQQLLQRGNRTAANEGISEE